MGTHHSGKRVRAGMAMLVVALVAALAFRHARTSGSAAEIDGQLTESRRSVDSLLHALQRLPLDSVTAPQAASALYVERVRLGLGSPFRVIDQLLRDPAFSTSERRELARALLAYVRDGAAYEVAPEALALVARSDAPTGARHLAMIDSAVSEARDPRAGELVVRLAYRLASASGAVSRSAPELATSAAAQARDRVLAARDVRGLVVVAARTGGDLFAVLREWRDARKFVVEQPVIVPLAARAERAAVAQLPRFVSRLEQMSSGTAAPAATGRDSAGAEAPAAGVARADGEGLARRMVQVAQQRDAPPLAPVTVSVASYAPLLRRADAVPASRLWRERFTARARSEEALVAEFALLRSRRIGGMPAASAAVLTAAVAMRPYAQERAWLYGDEAPSAHDLQTRYGVTVTYDSAVRAWWRPYLRRTLASALGDMRRILSSYDPRGLRVHFGANPMGERALALHDPVRRTVYFPVGSSAGVMAHEFAHDLDWLAARRHYNGTGWYRTDRAARHDSDQLAGLMRQMAGATRLDTTQWRGGLARRPTELFARNVDWFMSAALAREGRVNGYLSAAQDPVLVGYGSAATPETAPDGGGVTLRALAEMTVLPTDLSRWFTSTFGAERRVSVHEVVREVLEAPLPASDLRAPSADAFWGAEAARAVLRESPAASGAWACLAPAFTERAVDAAAARAAMQFAAEARARGVIRQWRLLATRDPGRRSARMRALAGGPWDPAITADLERELRDAILWRAMSGRREGIHGALAASVAPRAEAGCDAPR